jgi:hypothetical protein
MHSRQGTALFTANSPSLEVDPLSKGVLKKQAIGAYQTHHPPQSPDFFYFMPYTSIIPVLLTNSGYIFHKNSKILKNKVPIDHAVMNGGWSCRLMRGRTDTVHCSIE